jgi:hypothetical protein
MVLIRKIVNATMEPSDHELILPLVGKEDSICLPLSIKAVSQYWNVNLPLTEAVEIAKKYPNIKGSILIEGIELAERHGLGSLILHSSITELKKVIDMGIPPIVILPGVHEIIQHASVISGYDVKEKTILHYIPEPDQIGAIPENQFDKLWAEDERILLILAPTDIISSIKQDSTYTNSNRFCFMSEKLNLQKNHFEAINYLKKAIELDKNNSTAFSLLGGILNEQNASDCVKYYEKSIELNHRSFLAYRGLGNYFLKKKQFGKAEYYYTKAIEINSSRFGPIYKNRGIARLEQNKRSEAKEDFNNYLSFTPNARDKKDIQQALNEI